MFRILLLLFIIIPIIEISLLIHVGQWLGAMPTIAIVIFTAWLGAKYVRQQGLQTLNNVQVKMAQGEMPSDEIIIGMLLLVAGVLLVTPGFMTDIFGLSLLVPSLRQSLINGIKKHFIMGNINGNFAGAASFQHGASVQAESAVNSKAFTHVNTPTSTKQGGVIIEGEYEKKE